MLLRNFRSRVAAAIAVAALVPGASLGAGLADAPEICDRAFARQILASRDYPALCGCETVTTAFIREIQKSRDFTDVLATVEALCPGLAQVLVPDVAAGPADSGPEPDGGGRGFDPFNDDPEDPNEDPQDPNEDPQDPGDDPQNPGDDPQNPGDDPQNPGDDPQNPGDDPQDPGDDPGNPDEPDNPTFDPEPV